MERTGFEPANAFTLTVFKTVAIDHSATSPTNLLYLILDKFAYIFSNFNKNLIRYIKLLSQHIK